MKDRTGVVYVMANLALPGVHKVGRTARGADRRAAQVTREYGTIDSFVIRSKHVVHDPVLVEALAHRILRRKRVKNTELFMVSAEDAMRAVKRAARIALHKRSWGFIWLWWLRRAASFQSRKGYGRKHESWALVGLFAVGAAVFWIAWSKPTLPDWLPQQIYGAAALVERLDRYHP